MRKGFSQKPQGEWKSEGSAIAGVLSLDFYLTPFLGPGRMWGRLLSLLLFVLLIVSGDQKEKAFLSFPLNLSSFYHRASS